MGQADKILQRMRDNPAADWRVADIEAVCRLCGLLMTAPRGGGSHYKIRRPGGHAILTVPARRPIKPVYIRALLLLIDGDAV
jgi:hypothetical protein